MENSIVQDKVLFPRIWCMPNRYTFLIKPVKELLNQEVGDGQGWADPFANNHSPAEWTNDTNPLTSTVYHCDALQFLKLETWKTLCAGVIFDPPYSAAMQGGKYANPAAWTKYVLMCKDEIARIVRPGGKVICFGWNSNGLGMKRGFKLVRGLLLAHGGSHQHDTIITVEVKQ
jgi:hypothetical protein